MSALGHKQTCAPQTAMSALPPKADMCGALGDVCFVPEADMLTINEFVGAGEERVQHSNAYCT